MEELEKYKCDLCNCGPCYVECRRVPTHCPLMGDPIHSWLNIGDRPLLKGVVGRSTPPEIIVPISDPLDLRDDEK